MGAKTASRKKLIEVSIPLEAINEASATEKSIRHAHPSTLHTWWARRPLAACRAILFAQLVDDPCACPDEFPSKAEQDAERDRLHKLIAALVPWEASNDRTTLNQARYEIARSLARVRGDKLAPLDQTMPQQIIDYIQENAPPLYDPFCGAGSIPLEAQRLGLKAMGSDLNPVAVLVSKALIEFPPKFAGHKPVNPRVNELYRWEGAQGLADDIRYYGRWVGEQAEKKIGHLYPKVKLKDGADATVIAWLWVRTVPSPDPRAKGAHVPLASSFILFSKPGREVIVKPVVDRDKMEWRFDICEKPSHAEIEAAASGTKYAGGFRCILTGTPLKFGQLRDFGRSKLFGARLMAMVAETPNGRVYCRPKEEHERLALSVRSDWRPEQPLDGKALGFRVPEYGLTRWCDLFTERQLVTLSTFSDLVKEVRRQVLLDARMHWSASDPDRRGLADGGSGPDAYADAVVTYLALTASKLAVFLTTQARWRAGEGKSAPGFGRQAIPMVWDFADLNPFAGAGGDWSEMTRAASKVIASLPATKGQIFSATAQQHSFPASAVVNTDPPYYDNIGYADLSDYFYVWLHRSLQEFHPDLFRRVLTPKTDELVATPHRHGGKEAAEDFFMRGMNKALASIRQVEADTPYAIYYAFKQSETVQDGLTSAGWSSFLQAVTDAGLAVDATWPVRTEGASRLRGQASNALASSIVLVCRRRDTSAPTVTRADFLRALRREMPAALAEIRHAGVGPTDIQQAAIGPSIGVFTRHAQVLNTDGTPMLVKDALKLINQVREEITSHGDGDYDSETRFALDWFAAKGFEKGRSGDAIIMTNAVNISLDSMNASGFFEARGGDARLRRRNELPDDWEPTSANRGTVWEACQHLIKRLTAEDGGIDAAAALYNRLGALADPAHALARRLYDICEQKQWAAEGYFYNQLHQEWDTIEKRAAALGQAGSVRDLFSR